LQSAYRKNHSTETALNKILDDVVSDVDGGSVVAMMSLDISAAFDAVDHNILVQRLQDEFGVSGLCRDWISSYLTGRTSTVHVGSSVSSVTTAQYGVPQGSVLGPILYAAYVTSIGRLINSFDVNYHQYADDTQLYTKLSTTPSTGLNKLQQCVSSLQHWFWSNGLLLNPDKSSIAFFGTRARLQQADLPSDINVAGASVTVSDELRVLGVTIDSRFSMDSHVNETVKNCNFHLQALRHIRKSITRDIANTIACSLISSRLDYCNSLLFGVSGLNLDKLQRIQNRAARIVASVSRRQQSTRDLLTELHWLPVRSRIEYKTAVLCYKAFRQHQPPYLSLSLKPYLPSRVLRSSTEELLVIPKHKTVLGSRRFSVAAPRIWNNLPLTTRTSVNFTVFKTALKTHLFRRFMEQ
jgi:hypothetical protein